jgi:transglutaminase-like putative cysteine protease
MLLEVSHRTTYTYSDPVLLGPHQLRLTPRPIPHQQLLRHALEVVPAPVHSCGDTDGEGNRVTHLHFEGPTDALLVHARFTIRIRPADPLPAHRPDEVPAEHGPSASPQPYRPPLRERLGPWIHQETTAAPVLELANTLSREEESPTAFPHLANAWLHHHIERQIRLNGPPHAPAETLLLGCGSCRDLTVLFMALCRARGFAARFASGYQPHPSTRRRQRFLHAWPEVYIPALGWVGFDPTHGQDDCHDHVPLAVCRDPDGAAPIIGTFAGSATSRIDVELHISAEE